MKNIIKEVGLLRRVNKLIIILLISCLFSEEFIYTLGFRFINVGKATISSEINSDNELTINTLVASSKFLDKLYKVRDQIKLTVNPDDFSLKGIEKKVHEGNWKRSYSAVIDSNFNIITKDKIIENDKLLFDPISIIYNLRNKDLTKGKKYDYHILGIDEITSLITEVKGKEKIKVPAGKYNCIKVVPYSNNGEDIFKENGYMTAWFSDDEKRIPVKIELKTNIGNMILKLKKIIP